MNIYSSGLKGTLTDSQRTSGEVEVLRATDGGIIEHTGNAKKAIALNIGLISVFGEVSEFCNASDSGLIFSRGDTELVRAAFLGSITIAGNPSAIEVSDHGEVIVFGKPKVIKARHSGTVTVVSAETDYEPENITITDHGSIRIISTGEEDVSKTTGHLGYHLEKVLPEGEINPLYVSYSGLIEHGHSRYLAV